MTCQACGTGGQPDGAKFCSECGAGLRPPGCPACGAATTPGAKFCSECGAPLGEPAAAGAPVASRRVTSVLFGDLVGFTSLSESRDQEEVRELLSRYFDECRQIIDRYGGTVEKFIGDAVMAVWGVPTAHEDDAERSVRAGLELVNRVEAIGADLGVSDLAMRVGIVTGEVAVTIGAEAQGMVAGDAVNTAARVQAAAAPGQIWVDETTRLLTSSAISYVDVGSHRLKGKVDPVPLWAVRAVVAGIGGSQRADGLEAPLVGRDRELRLVKEIFHGVEESRRPALLVVDGEPGSGKSRLAWEFEKYVDGLTYVARWHSGRCLSYGEGVAYYALAEAIRVRLQALRPDPDPTDAEEDQAALLELGLGRFVPDPDERDWLRPRLGALLGVGAVGTFPREDLFSAWATFLHRVSEDEHAVVLVIDDAQHADDSLLQFLEYLLGVGSFPCLVLLLTRPGLLEQNPALATNRRATVLHLEALPEADMERLLDGLVAGLPGGVRTSLVDRSEGVPLFAVETVRALIDRDLVVPRGGQYVLAAPDRLDLDAVGAPASLQALISARLDTLDADQRRVIDRASVVGDAFTRDQIARLCPEVADLDGVLGGLVRLQLLRQESSRFTTELGHYQFVQGAVRQVAYGMLSRHDRKAGHLAVVELLRSEEAALGERAPIVAQHLLEALDAVPDAPDHVELATLAVTTLREAAERAGAIGAPSEAAGHLKQALARCSDRELGATIERDLAEMLHRAGDGEVAVRHAEHATRTFEDLGHVAGTGSAVAVWASVLVSLGSYEEARALAEPRYAEVRERGDLPRVELELSRALTSCYLRDGTDLLQIAAEHARLAEFIGDSVSIADSYNALSVHFLRVGPRELSRLLLTASADIARTTHDNRGLARALLNLNAEFTQEDAARGAEFGRESLATTSSIGDQSWRSSAVINLLLALMVNGAWEEALDVVAEDMVADLETPYQEVTRYVVHRARNQPWTPSPGFLRAVSEQDPAIASVRTLVGAIQAADAGDATAADLAASAVRQMFDFGGLYDDFAVVFLLATEVLCEVGDLGSVEELVRTVEERRRERPPTGVRFQCHRLRAILGAAADAAPDTVEGHFREAVDHAAAWHSEPWLARARAELGVWLSRRGRTDEAERLLEQARATYESLGAARWLLQLENELAGART